MRLLISTSRQFGQTERMIGRRRWVGLVTGLVAGLLLLAGCEQQLGYQPYYRPLEPSTFFPDGRSSRHLVEGTVARGQLRTDPLLYEGEMNGEVADVYPFPITQEVLARGQERYEIYCSPCHSRIGDGNGLVVQRGFPSPPTFHNDRLRQVPVGYLFQVAKNGLGVMPSYGEEVPTEDLWAITAYVRVLQLSQYAPTEAVPPEVLEQLEAGP